MRLLMGCWLAAFGICLLLPPAPAKATEAPEDVLRARKFFEVGAQAYSRGQYLLAIDAFEQALALTSRPGLVFSLAQAHNRQFRSSGDPQHLTKAIHYYRRYLAGAAGGERQAEASATLNRLLVLSENLRPKEELGTAGRQLFGRLLLSTSTPGAKLTVNGETIEALPTSLELPSGKYRIEATAPGFRPRGEEVSLASGSVIPVTLALEELPARLEVRGPRGAEVFLDGRSVGWLPLNAFEVPQGRHWVSLRRAGRRTRNTQVELERGETTRVAVEMETTLQRDATWLVGGTAVIAAATSATLAVLAYGHARRADELDEKLRQQGQISLTDAKSLNSALQSEDDLRTGAAIAGIAAGVFAGSALLLYFADTPAPPLIGHRDDSARYRSFGWSPMVGKTWGVAADGRF